MTNGNSSTGQDIVEEIDDNLEPADESYDADYDFEDEVKVTEPIQKESKGRGLVKTGKTILPPTIQFETESTKVTGKTELTEDEKKEVEAFDNFFYCDTPEEVERKEIVAFSTGVALTILIFSSAIVGYLIGKNRKKVKQ